MTYQIKELKSTLKVVVIVFALATVISGIIFGIKSTFAVCEALNEYKFYLAVLLVISTFSLFFGLAYIGLTKGFTLTKSLFVVKKQNGKFGFYLTLSIYLAISTFIGFILIKVLINVCN